jgi:hypothetical protein
MIDFAAAMPGWSWIVDAGRRTPPRDSAGGTDREGGWRSGAARRGQTGVGVVESII